MEQANLGVYSKVLSKTDVTEKMSVPTRWVGEKRLLPMPKPGEPTVLPVRGKDRNGNDTTIRLAVRRRKEGQQRYHMRPHFMSKEWRALVVAYNLQIGDRVYFWRQGKYLRVSRTRPLEITLFKACIGIIG